LAESLLIVNIVQSVAEVKLELAKEEVEELAKGIVLNEMMASTYISSVIALEDQKYVHILCMFLSYLISTLGTC